MRILYLRTNNFQYDSRVSKELKTLSMIENSEITCFGWNRNGKNSKKVSACQITIEEQTFNGYLADIYGPWGRGPRKNFLPLLSFILVLKKWLKKNIHNYDVIHCVDLATAYYAIPLAKKHGVKIVYDIFDYFPDVRKYPKMVRCLFAKAEDRCINNSDVTIICSEARRKQIRSAKPKKLVVIHNSPNINPFDYDCKLQNEEITFAYIGNLVNDRLIDLILDYFSINQQYILKIGGIGLLSKKADDFSKKYKNIVFYGPLDYSNVLKIENSADIIFALYDPRVINHRYVASNKFYETLALGKQIIMCAGTGMDDEVKKYNLGVLIEPNYESLAVGINELVKNKEDWIKSSEEKKKLFESDYSWKIMSERLKDIYKSL